MLVYLLSVSLFICPVCVSAISLSMCLFSHTSISGHLLCLWWTIHTLTRAIYKTETNIRNFCETMFSTVYFCMNGLYTHSYQSVIFIFCTTSFWEGRGTEFTTTLTLATLALIYAIAHFANWASFDRLSTLGTHGSVATWLEGDITWSLTEKATWSTDSHSL